MGSKPRSPLWYDLDVGMKIMPNAVVTRGLRVDDVRLVNTRFTYAWNSA
jgi:hypothetical protein